jgi:hypothetical protein
MLSLRGVLLRLGGLDRSWNSTDPMFSLGKPARAS